MTSESAKFETWHARRVAQLAGPDSWYGIIGLNWLGEGDNSVGSAPDTVVPLPTGPALAGFLRVESLSAAWHPAGGAVQALETDRDGKPTVIALGDLAFFVVERDGRLAARVRDRAWAKKRVFPGQPVFPFDPAWQIAARWVALPEPRVTEVPNVSGDLKPVTLTHQAEFLHGGEKRALLPVSEGKDSLLFVFRDGTSGRGGSYGAGRFLQVPRPAGEDFMLDFNRAFNPPCAYTAFATCPLPPPENWLPFPVTAGEQAPPKD